MGRNGPHETGNKGATVALSVLAVIVLALVGFVMRPTDAPPASLLSVATVTTAAAPAELTVAGVGDSVIFNAGSWFREAIEGSQVKGLVSVGNFGVPGAGTDGIRSKSLIPALEKRPEVVLIGGGTNDILSAVPRETTIANLRAMVVSAKAAGARPVLETIPPSDERPGLVIPMNDAIRDLAKSERVPLLDLYTVVGTDSGHYRDGMTEDLRHPNPNGYAAMTIAAVRQLTALHLTG